MSMQYIQMVPIDFDDIFRDWIFHRLSQYDRYQNMGISKSKKNFRRVVQGIYWQNV